MKNKRTVGKEANVKKRMKREKYGTKEQMKKRNVNERENMGQ